MELAKIEECVKMIINAKELTPDQRFAFACFLLAERNRHQQDIDNANRDLEELRALGVDVDRAYDMGFVVCGEVA